MARAQAYFQADGDRNYKRMANLSVGTIRSLWSWYDSEFGSCTCPKEDLARIWVLRKVLNPLSPVAAMELLIDKLGKTPSNGQFLSNMSSI